MSSQDPSEQLKVTDNKVDGKLVKALTVAKSTNPNRGPLVEWLQTSQACNQKEYVGFLRAAFELRPRAVKLKQGLGCMFADWNRDGL